jgi:hypothetical protein
MLKIDIKTAARVLDITYEQCRKLCKDGAFPSYTGRGSLIDVIDVIKWKEARDEYAKTTRRR